MDVGNPAARPLPTELNLQTENVPQVLTRLLQALGLDDALGVGHGSQLAASPTGTKPLTEMLGDVFNPKTQNPGIPKRVRLTSLDPEKNEAVTHALDKNYSQMNSSVDDLGKLIKSGELIPEGLKTEGMSIEQLMKRLAGVMRRAPK